MRCIKMKKKAILKRFRVVLLSKIRHDRNKARLKHNSNITQLKQKVQGSTE